MKEIKDAVESILSLQTILLNSDKKGKHNNYRDIMLEFYPKIKPLISLAESVLVVKDLGILPKKRKILTHNKIYSPSEKMDRAISKAVNNTIDEISLCLAKWVNEYQLAMFLFNQECSSSWEESSCKTKRAFREKAKAILKKYILFTRK